VRRDGLETQRWNMLHPQSPPKLSYLESVLKDRSGPIIAATDYMKLFADQVRGFLPTRHFVALGTDGFGRSDYRKRLRKFFEVDRHYVAVAALKALADQEVLPHSKVTAAIKKYDIDPETPNPVSV
jgi:pyruvate dehydrogenase E1 component